MSYEYSKERPTMFTDEGQRMFLEIRDHTRKLFTVSGAATIGRLMAGARGGDSFMMLACVDRLKELGEIEELPNQDRPTQLRVCVPTSKFSGE